jgi:hypothetical protein
MRIFTIKRGDTSPALLYALFPSTINLAGSTVVFNMRKRRTEEVKVDRSPASVVAGTDPVLQYEWDAADTDESGEFEGEFEVTYGDSTIETFPNKGYIPISIDEDIG